MGRIESVTCNYHFDNCSLDYAIPYYAIPFSLRCNDTTMLIDQGLVDRTQALLSDFNNLLDHNPAVNGELRVKLSKAELCLFKIASLMQETVDMQNT